MPSQSFRVKNSIEVGTGVTISSSGNITAGVLTATSFVGSGSQLTNIVANYSSVSGVSSYASLSGISSSVVGGAVSATSLRVTGVSTFEGAISVRNGYNLNIGDNNDLRIYNDGTDSRIEETGSGLLKISGSNINIEQHSTNETIAKFIGGGAVELYYNDNKKLETTGTGVTVTGTLFGTEASFTGILTASSFRGDGSQLTGIAATTNVRTNSLVVSGVSTFTGNVSVGSSVTYTSGNAAIFTAPARPSLSIYQSTSANEAFLEYAGTDLNIRSYGSTYIWSDVDGSAGFPLVADSSGSAQLYFGTNKKLETLGAGVTITGTTFTNQLNVSGVTTLGTVQVSSGIITASSGITTFYGDISNAVSGRWILGADGSSNYTFTGIGFTQTTNDPTLYLKRGEVYEFVNNSGGSHPFQIRVSNGGAAYNNGVTNNGSATGTIRFEVPYNAPDTLFYQCTNHSGMFGTIKIYDRSVPINAHNAASYTLALSDAGGCVREASSGSNITVPADVFSAGDAMTIFNVSAGSITITQGSSTTLYNAADATTGNRTLAAKGIATVLCTSSNEFVISGARLS